MAKTDLTNQRQVIVEEYVRSGEHLEAAKKSGYKDTHSQRNQACKLLRECIDDHLWSERWDRILEDIFVVQDEVSEAIARRVAPSVTGHEQKRLTRKRPENLSAWEEYLQGLRCYYERPHTDYEDPGLTQARIHFENAIE